MITAVEQETTLQSATEKVDGWENVATAIGTSRDKRSGGWIRPPRTNTDYKEYEDLYFSDDLAATAADLPAKEMVRAWISIQANDSSTVDDKSRTEEASTEEQISIGNLVLDKLEELHSQSKFAEGEIWARVFGGALLFIGADDGGGDDPESMAQPLDENNIQSIDYLLVFDRWDVQIDSYYQDPSNEKFGTPEFYRLNVTAAGGDVPYPTERIHESRFIRFDGVKTNKRRTKANGGWCDSIYARNRDLLRDYNLAWGGISNMLQDFSQGIFKMKGLRDAILADKDDLVLRRMAIIDMCRSIGRAVPLDSDDEDFMRQQTPVSGLPELMDRFGYRMSAAFRMPATLLFGQSPSGMQATGASDIRFFYDQISAAQETILRPKLERLIRLIFLSKDGPTNGVEPDEWSFKFNPLYQLTEMEQAELRNKQAQTDQIYLTEGVVAEDEISYSRFGGDRYSADTTLDLEQRAEDKLADEAEPEPDPEPPMIDPMAIDPEFVAPEPDDR